MSYEETEDTTIYEVVMNHEEQYSIWPTDRENPRGWTIVGKSGPKAECLDYIKEVWTDMRPLSLRKQMEADAVRLAADQPALTQRNEAPARSTRNDLIEYLSEGDHPVEISLRPAKTVKAFREQIDAGYVHVKFTDTSGGTELAVKLDPAAVALGQADFENQTGTVHLEGFMTLNYVKVRCIARINLQTLAGAGQLMPVPA